MKWSGRKSSQPPLIRNDGTNEDGLPGKGEGVSCTCSRTCFSFFLSSPSGGCPSCPDFKCPPPHPHLLPLLLPILLGQQLRVGTTCKEGGDVIAFKSLVEEVDKPEDVPSSSSFDRSTQPKPPILLCLPAPSNRPFPAAPPSSADFG